MGKKLNTVVVGDCAYLMTAAYRNGAQAMRDGVPWVCCPHRDGTQAYSDWDAGHTHEAAGEHIRFGLDVINAPASATWFKEDPAVPRDNHGVLAEWYRKQLCLLAGGTDAPSLLHC